jgi:hypothetical protein
MKIAELLDKILSYDITRRTWVEEFAHPYFGNIIFSAAKAKERNFWQGTIECKFAYRGQIEVDMGGRPDGELAEEKRFCESIISNVESLLKSFEPYIKPVYENYLSRLLPENIANELVLASISIPDGCNEANEWQIGFVARSTSSYIDVHLVMKDVQYVTIEG